LKRLFGKAAGELLVVEDVDGHAFYKGLRIPKSMYRVIRPENLSKEILKDVKSLMDCTLKDCIPGEGNIGALNFRMKNAEKAIADLNSEEYTNSIQLYRRLTEMIADSMVLLIRGDNESKFKGFDK